MSDAEEFTVLCPQCGEGDDAVYTVKTRRKQAVRAAERHNTIHEHEAYVEGFE